MMNVKLIEAAEFPIQRVMTALLRWITVAAGVVILTGGVLLLLRQGSDPTVFHTFIGEPNSLRSVPQIAVGAFHGDALAIVQFGILLLVTTPVLRVFFVGIGYMLERDWLYVTVAGIVLAVLGSSLLGHKL
jgi:uncharacterized membrane protein